MLKAQNISITTHKGRKLIEDFSYVLNKGEKTALIGEEGNGKSTLLKVLAGIDVSDYVQVSGSVESKDHIAYLPQKIDDTREVYEYILEGRDEEEIGQVSRRMKTDLTRFKERNLQELSGGERVRVALAKVLIEDPDILLLDEPTNDLDLKTLIWLEEFIKNSDLGVLFISHDETLLRNCAEAVIHIEQLKRKAEPHITISGESYDEYQKRRTDLIDRTNQIAAKEKAELKKQLDRYRQIYQKVEHRQTIITRQDPHGGALLKKKMKSLKAQGRKLDEKKEKQTQKYEPEEAIDIFFNDVSINPNKILLDVEIPELIVEDRILSKDIRFHMEGKDKVCIIGENGSGKTTLLKILYEKLKERPELNCAYMPQNYDEVLNMEESPQVYLERITGERTKGASLLGSLRFTTEEMTHRIADLSEGQKCKTLLAGLILSDPDVLIMDEPTRNLSPLSGPQLRKMLNEYKGAILAVSHDRSFIDEVADTVYELDEDGLYKIG
ncbi:MAG: ABC-F family ATP-binding cassette domain-containing protein [Erysipelotrichaceae bacterium]|nr:ABC-F family ATP-binding cassette domain-containing protein [Erysipelotrichaceae bacterium]